MSTNDKEQNSALHITRRELNTGMVSGALTLLAPNSLANVFAAANKPPRIDATVPSVRLIHERAWAIGNTDESTHVLGNGRAMVHELGPNIVYFRAPWISSPNLLTMTLVAPVNVRTISSREQGTTIWHHKLFLDSMSVGEIIDFIDEDRACLKRTLSLSIEITFSLQTPRLVDYSRRYVSQASLVGQWPYGTTIYGNFKASDPFTLQLILPKQSRIRPDKSDVLDSEVLHTLKGDMLPRKTLLQLPAGDSEMLIAAGASIEECFSTTDLALTRSARESLVRTRGYWRSRLSEIKWSGQQNHQDISVEPVIDDIATLLLGHQSHQGSICAGQVYPLFYVRDQYGVSKALLALNMTAEARSILAYYHQIWLSYGRIHNAQSDGPRHWFHKAENDDVEMTGYLVIQAFDYLKASKDEAFMVLIFPMLEWALNIQVKQLFSGMLPFNGDETYVAGGIFPRTHLCDGSSEATLLYLAATDRLLSWGTTSKLWPTGKIQRYREIAAAVKQNYNSNFGLNDRLMTNHPRVPEVSELPRFRFGVCLGQYDDNCLFLSDTEIGEDGRYFCFSCYPQRTLKTYEADSYFIPSVGLTSSLISYDVGSPKMISATLSGCLDRFTRDGSFAWPDSALPGYETAVVSLALSQQHHPRTSEFIQRMLELRDPTGAWAEYYVGAKPKGCRCRPWESALSLFALLQSVVS